MRNTLLLLYSTREAQKFDLFQQKHIITLKGVNSAYLLRTMLGVRLAVQLEARKFSRSNMESEN